VRWAVSPCFISAVRDMSWLRKHLMTCLVLFKIYYPATYCRWEIGGIVCKRISSDILQPYHIYVGSTPVLVFTKLNPIAVLLDFRNCYATLCLPIGFPCMKACKKERNPIYKPTDFETSAGKVERFQLQSYLFKHNFVTLYSYRSSCSKL
jgi:hypothetical protein